MDKTSYLTGLLKGEAARGIQVLPLSESNYQRAVDLLEERFGQKQVLINAHMDALLKIPSAKNDVKKLRSFYDATLVGSTHTSQDTILLRSALQVHCRRFQKLLSMPTI